MDSWTELALESVPRLQEELEYPEGKSRRHEGGTEMLRSRWIWNPAAEMIRYSYVDPIKQRKGRSEQ